LIGGGENGGLTKAHPSRYQVRASAVGRPFSGTRQSVLLAFLPNPSIHRLGADGDVRSLLTGAFCNLFRTTIIATHHPINVVPQGIGQNAVFTGLSTSLLCLISRLSGTVTRLKTLEFS